MTAKLIVTFLGLMLIVLVNWYFFFSKKKAGVANKMSQKFLILNDTISIYFISLIKEREDNNYQFRYFEIAPNFRKEKKL